MDEPPSALSEVQKVAGGVELEIAYEDGRTERVKVRQLSPIKDFDRYLAAMQNDEADSVELYCGREKGWAETLSAESFNAIANKGQELNLPLFRDSYRRLKARSEAINPGFLEKATSAALEKILHPEPASP
jgi:hypothetical protein